MIQGERGSFLSDSGAGRHFYTVLVMGGQLDTHVPRERIDRSVDLDHYLLVLRAIKSIRVVVAMLVQDGVHIRS